MVTAVASRLYNLHQKNYKSLLWRHLVWHEVTLDN